MKRLLFLFVSLFAAVASADQPFSELVGPVVVGEVQTTVPQELPYITWGADTGVFYANGLSVETKPDSMFASVGLNYKLVNGDDFVKQCRDYVSGKRPMIRATMGQLGLASEVLSKDARTKPVIIVQLSYSLGDHVVARSGVKNLDDIKKAVKAGKKLKVCFQRGGPHHKLIDDSLKLAQATWNDIEVVFVDDLTGDKGPAVAFQKDPSIDMCCVITPDMITLTGGLESVGGTAEGNVSGSHVVNSTFNMSKSIADVYAVRKDYYDAHKDEIKKFVAMYLKACEKIVAMRGEFNTSATLTPEYKNVLEFTKATIGAPVWSLEADTHGLLTDASFVSLSGNESFFRDAGNLEGFEGQQRAVLDLATGQGYARIRAGFFANDFNYPEIATLAGINYVPMSAATVKTGKAEDTTVFPDSMEKLDENTLVSFTINFARDQETFSADTYGAEFNRVIEQISKFGKNRAVIVIRGHSDPTATLTDFLKAGMEMEEGKPGHISRTGTSGSYRYFITVDGTNKALDLTQTNSIMSFIQLGTYDGGKYNPRERMLSALNLSKGRAEAVKQTILDLAAKQKINLDADQMQPVGLGISEPVIAKPRNEREAAENMRVEFRLVRRAAETVKQSDFDF